MADRIDRERLGRKTKAEILDEVEILLEDSDTEHGQRLRLQADSVMHLMKGRAYEQELGMLHIRIVQLEQQLEMAQQELRKFKGEITTAYNIQLL